MTSILQSIKPQHCERIAAGKKTIEVRKTRPKCDVPFKVYIYCTQAKKFDELLHKEMTAGNVTFNATINGKVIGEYVCDHIEGTCIWRLKGQTLNLAKRNEFETNMPLNACLSIEEIEKYAGKSSIYGWHISNLKIYDKPRELSEFYKCCGTQNCRSCQFWLDNGEYTVCTTKPMRQLKRPPQNWCYVEEIAT